MPRYILLVLACLASVALPPPSFAQDESTLKLRNSWSEFPVGSWSKLRLVKQVRGTGDSLEVISRCETLTRLSSVDSDGYHLQLNVVLDLGERSFENEPQTISRGYMRQSLGERIRTKRLGRRKFAVDGRVIPTDLYEVTYGSGVSERTARFQYSHDVFPFVIQHETQASSKAGQVDSWKTVVEVTALNLPQKVLNSVKSVAHVKAIQTQPERTIVTREVHCAEIPGGVVSHSSVTRNSDGVIIERSTLSLLDFGVEPKELGRQSRVMQRRRRSRRSASL